MSEAGLLCSTCRHRLGVDELTTCRACVADVRGHLVEIPHAYRRLPDLLDQLRSNAPQPGRGRAAERPMPGGDVLVMLAAGSSGLAARWRTRDADRAGRAHDEPPQGADSRRNDTPSVAYELARWVETWWLARRETEPVRLDVDTAAHWLRERLPWAAAHHRGFAEFALDMRRLRHRIEVVAGLDDRPERAGVPCFDCGGDLERPYGHHGREDDWTCRVCRRVYDQVAYLLAVRAQLEEIE